MLTFLSIKNYALIDDLSVDFKDKLTIITGETGAGKSILLGALGLALGKRVDSTALKYSAEKCIVEAHFRIDHYELEPFFDGYDLDFEVDTIVRREILPSGKSRAFVNDTPTTLQVLSALGERLIDVHSQHQTLKLSDTNFQFSMLDNFARATTLVEHYGQQLNHYNKLRRDLAEMKERQEQAIQQYEYNRFQFDELEKANLKEDEQEEIEMELDKLNNMEAIRSNLAEALSNALKEDHGLQDKLSGFNANLGAIKPYSREFSELSERISSLKIEFDDVLATLEQLYESINFDTNTYDRLNERLQLLMDLQKKHGADSVRVLLQIQEDLDEKVRSVEDLGEYVHKQENELKELAANLDQLANQLSAARKKAIPGFVSRMEEIVAGLGMENTRFQFNLEHTDSYYQQGKDVLEFLISANKGSNFGPVKKIASGGELSRIMLAVKAILSENMDLPTIIFDEIDAGVSGDVSQKMAAIMETMAHSIQIIAITHLPQIAARGKQHFKIYKSEKEDAVVTQLKVLDSSERIVEIAEMLSSKEITNTALEHAKQLLN